MQDSPKHHKKQQIKSQNKPKLKPKKEIQQEDNLIVLKGILEQAKTEKYDPDIDVQKYGFFEWRNRYFSINDDNKIVSFSNFTMKVLYHMNNGTKPRRIIEITNDLNHKKVVDIETDKLTTKGEFKKFCEGLGNFRFTGSESKLDQIKAKLYDQEQTAVEVRILGHNNDFWAWGNGIFVYGQNKFIQASNTGFSNFNDVSYYLPSANENLPNRVFEFGNELRFVHNKNSIQYNEFLQKYYNVFGNNGAVTFLFSCACLFSDIIYNIKGFFPMVFIYGEGGSGKGSAIKFCQKIFGKPQEPLTLSGKANTDKAKIANFAQFINACLLLEEYTNNPETDQLLKNLWDRYGYKRRKMDNSFRTETVPISSGVAITGNFVPNDDPLLQRIVLLEHSINQFSQDEKEKFNDLKEVLEYSATNTTHTILKYRANVEDTFNEINKKIQKDILAQLGPENYYTDRMIENIAVILSMYKILSPLGFPFKYYDIEQYLINQLKKQCSRRASVNSSQTFFDVFASLITARKVVYNRDFTIEGNVMYMFFKKVHTQYIEQHRIIYGKPGETYSNLFDKLKDYLLTAKQCNIEQKEVAQEEKLYRFQYRIKNAVTTAIAVNLLKVEIDIKAILSNLDEGEQYSQTDNQKNYKNYYETDDNKPF